MSTGSPDATAVSGAAGGGTSAGANSSLERCPAPLGTLAVDDGRGKEWYASFGAATKVTTIEPLIRLAVQQSNCFVITSVGNARTESKLSAITDKQRNARIPKDRDPKTLTLDECRTMLAAAPVRPARGRFGRRGAAAKTAKAPAKAAATKAAAVKTAAPAT